MDVRPLDGTADDEFVTEYGCDNVELGEVAFAVEFWVGYEVIGSELFRVACALNDCASTDELSCAFRPCTTAFNPLLQLLHARRHGPASSVADELSFAPGVAASTGMEAARHTTAKDAFILEVVQETSSAVS